MEKRNLGNTGTKVGALGIGAMSFSDFYGPTNTQESHAILKLALDSGVDQIEPLKTNKQQMVGQGYDEATARQYAEQYYAAYYAQQGQGGGN